MRDLDIRQALRDKIAAQHRGDTDTLIIDELGLCQGRVRVDLAVVNGTIHGYEIKSARDTLARLPEQVRVYSEVCNFVSIVTAGVHLKHVRELVPKWWGIEQALITEGKVVVRQIRKARSNPSISIGSIVQLLWRDEALELLRRNSLDAGVASKPRAAIWSRLVESIAPETLMAEIRNQLRSRPAWRADGRQRSDGGSFQPFATS